MSHEPLVIFDPLFASGEVSAWDMLRQAEAADDAQPQPQTFYDALALLYALVGNDTLAKHAIRRGNAGAQTLHLPSPGSAAFVVACVRHGDIPAAIAAAQTMVQSTSCATLRKMAALVRMALIERHLLTLAVVLAPSDSQAIVAATASELGMNESDVREATQAHEYQRRVLLPYLSSDRCVPSVEEKQRNALLMMEAAHFMCR